MYGTKQKKRLFIICLGLLAVLWMLFDFMAVDTIVKPTQASAEDSLLNKIKAAATSKRIEPVDARVDPVWKAIPGYNGREVDIESTLRIAKKLGKNIEQLPWVYKPIPPRVQLEHLGAHPIYKGNPNKPMAAIMVNVAWGNEYIPQILDIFEQNNVKATFFFDGSWLRNNQAMAADILHDGHEIGNHGYSHRNMSELSRSDAMREITKTEALLQEQLNVKSKLFAPPSGDYDQETVEIAHELHMKTILWTIDTVDWKNPHPQAIVRKIKANIEPGSLILMHPKASSTAALPQIIQTIRHHEIELGTVSDVLSPERMPNVESNVDFW